MTAALSAKNVLLSKLVELLKQVRNGAYTVKRGAINWALWDFNTHPRAIAVGVDEGTPWESKTRTQLGHSARLSLDCLTRMPDAGEDQMLDDGRVDEIEADFVWALEQLGAAVDSRGDSIAIRIDFEGALSLEQSREVANAQGVLLLFEVNY